MPIHPSADNPNEFEERLYQLEAKLEAEQWSRELLERRVRNMEEILEAYGLKEEDGEETVAEAKVWLLANVRPKKRERLSKLISMIEQNWNGKIYEFKEKGRERVAVFCLFNEIQVCLNVTQADFIRFIMNHTNLGKNPHTIKSSLRYAMNRKYD